MSPFIFLWVILFHLILTGALQTTVPTNHIDFIVKGEGEQTLLELVRALQEGKKEFAEIEGLGWKHNGMNILNDDRDFLDIEVSSRSTFNATLGVIKGFEGAIKAPLRRH